MNKERTNTCNKHWGPWAKGYLKIAELGFLYLKKEKNVGKNISPPGKGIYGLTNGCLVIASIWNIKHGIELLIKSLGIQIDKKYWEKHNLNFLIQELITKADTLFLAKHVKILKKIVQKYYNCNFSKKTIFLDKENTLFKYPQMKNGGTLDYTFVHDLKRKEINQFIRDINNLKEIYEVLEAQPSYFKDSRRFNINRKLAEKKLTDLLNKKGYKF